MIFNYQSYTTSKTIHQLLSMLGKIECEKKVPNQRTKWDFFIDNLVVEFDGESHYRDPFVIMRDEEKDSIAKDLGYEVIRIPYFIQLTTETYWQWFVTKRFRFHQIISSIHQNYPHGFIDKKAALPSSFCKLGLERFEREIKAQSSNIYNDIKLSLTDKIFKFGERYVIEDTTRKLFQL